jgi:exo-beta-1,3-glucanase (GH17 family)
MHVCYSPYHRISSAPPAGVTEADVDADMKIVSSYFQQIRTYGVDGGNQWNVDKARKYNIREMAVGVWVFPGNPSATNAQIDMAIGQLVAAAKKYGGFRHIDLVIGNEVNRTDVAVYSAADILNGMAYAKQAAKVISILDSVYVTTCFSGTVLEPGKPDAAKWLPVVDACDERTLLTVYPWYGGAPPNNINAQMQWSWDNGLKQVQARSKEVVIAEIGWPSAGGRDTSVQNERINYETTKAWVTRGNPMNIQFNTYWFEMFDEPWKTKEGPQGPYWGLFTSGPNPQPKFPFTA